jgi:hypothetical protein
MADLDLKQRIELWGKYEDIAMHFNELLIRLRTQALGAVATIVTAAGFLVSRGSTSVAEEPWWAVLVVSLLLLIAWCTLWMIDLFYYCKLLRGAVNSLLKLERESDGVLDLSTNIEQLFRPPNEHERRLNWPLWAFYGPIALFLLTVTVFSIWKVI